jgi:hypothetical protein
MSKSSSNKSEDAKNDSADHVESLFDETRNLR